MAGRTRPGSGRSRRASGGETRRRDEWRRTFGSTTTWSGSGPRASQGRGQGRGWGWGWGLGLGLGLGLGFGVWGSGLGFGLGLGFWGLGLGLGLGFGFGLGLGLPPRPGVAEDAPIVVTLAVDYEKSFARGLRPSVDPGRKQLHFRMDTAARSPRAAPQGTALTSRAPSPEPQQRASPSTLRPRSLLFRPSAWVLVVAQHRLRPTVQGRVLHPPSGQPRRVATRAGTHARSLVFSHFWQDWQKGG